MIDDLDNVDFISSNVHSSRQEALLYIFEDNEAVIKMIMKGRSPTMRHVSRTHRVALDWLFDRINLDPKIQIKYIDNKNQLADILTKGNFTRDDWNHLSKPMMNLVSRYSARDPNVLASTASESPVKTKFESQNVPLSSLSVQQPSTGRPVFGASSSNYSEWNIDDTSGLLKCGNLMKCWEQVRGDPQITSLSSMMIWTLTPPQNRTFL